VFVDIAIENRIRPNTNNRESRDIAFMMDLLELCVVDWFIEAVGCGRRDPLGSWDSIPLSNWIPNTVPDFELAPGQSSDQVELGISASGGRHYRVLFEIAGDKVLVYRMRHRKDAHV
jgi:hypothetical protein